ncbi:MAG: glycerol-3-phosphate dehydrogenase/oxidase [Flavisolibacter sp.]
MIDRSELIRMANAVALWDIVVIGGGATGLGIAVDAASRGLKTLLLESSDFAKGTSSRSTKLIHGGVRYLEQGNFSLVYTALRERGMLLNNAPHLVHPQSFIIPCYSLWQIVKYATGLKLYDLLSGRLSFGRSKYLNKSTVLQLLPGVIGKSLRGGIQYFDGQFDDARLAINLAQTALEEGGVVLNYFRVTQLHKNREGKISEVVAFDQETNLPHRFISKVVINATGVFADNVLKMDQAQSPSLVTASQGIHLVIDKRYLKGNSALMIPQTSDGRVLFAVPWSDHVLVGTTDTPVPHNLEEPTAKKEEVEFILSTLKQFIAPAPDLSDILSVFAGLRPLVKDERLKTTKDLSRDHKIIINKSGLLTITGGKWTTYRKMAEEAVNVAKKIGDLNSKPCRTKIMKIHGWSNSKNSNDPYGSDRQGLEKLLQADASLNNKLVEKFEHTEGEVIWAVRNEMARTIEDVLARRMRILFLDVAAAKKAAPRVAMLMAVELGYDEVWKAQQLKAFNNLASHYNATSFF